MATAEPGNGQKDSKRKVAVAKLDTYRSEITNHVRIAVTAGTEGSNVVKVVAKDFVIRPKGAEERWGESAGISSNLA
jgi:hypothetical protein